MSVCRRWRDCVLSHPSRVADMLREVHGPEEALVRAAGCTSQFVDRLALLTETLKTAKADCKNGEALVEAARAGNEAVARWLLESREHAPRANCRDGQALLEAATNGHVVIVRLLLEWREHAPRSDCQEGKALVSAAAHGHVAMVRLLLDWREHAPRADCQDGQALIVAAAAGHHAIVRQLLEWREHAPPADCKNGEALVRAVENDHEAVVRLLWGKMGWRQTKVDRQVLGRRIVQLGKAIRAAERNRDEGGGWAEMIGNLQRAHSRMFRHL